MEGAWGTMDPDKVDGETGNFWRALYKLEKQFSDVPNAQKIAARVNLICFCAVYIYLSNLLLSRSLYKHCRLRNTHMKGLPFIHTT